MDGARDQFEVGQVVRQSRQQEQGGSKFFSLQNGKMAKIKEVYIVLREKNTTKVVVVMSSLWWRG